jgi:hypothetical protein
MSTEAMKQALDALVKADRISGHPNNKKPITALRAAIAEASMQRLTDVQQEMEHEPVAYVVGYFDGHLVIKPTEPVVLPTGMALYTHPPCQVVRDYRTTEPVAYLCKHTGWFRRAEDADAAFKADAVPLYEALRREWVWLTDEEKLSLAEGFYSTDIVRVEAVEAKLKEKNHV